MSLVEEKIHNKMNFPQWQFKKKKQSEIWDSFHKDSKNKLIIKMHGLPSPQVPPFYK